MTGSTSFLTRLALLTALAAVALSAGATSAGAMSSCGIVTAGGHSWIVVAKGVSCASAKNVVRGFSARTAALRSGQSHVVPSPLAGFTCLIASRGKPGGSCSTAGATKSILWLSA